MVMKSQSPWGTMLEEEIEVVKEFPYLGSVVAVSGQADSDIDNRIAKASKAFRALRRAVFLDKNLTSQESSLVESQAGKLLTLGARARGLQYFVCV